MTYLHQSILTQYTSATINVYVLRVFTDINGDFGNSATVVIDEGRQISDTARKNLVQMLGNGETVFVNSTTEKDISIGHPQGEIDFAGVAALAAASILFDGDAILSQNLNGRAGEIIVSQQDNLFWAQASLASMPPWQHKEFKTAGLVESIILTETLSWQPTMVWAWLNKEKSLIRARTFAAQWGIPEAQGNGSGSMMLAAIIGREIEIKHGKGSIIFARLVDDNSAEIGRRVIVEKSKLVRV